jgi:hypothetical protein
MNHNARTIGEGLARTNHLLESVLEELRAIRRIDGDAMPRARAGAQGEAFLCAVWELAGSERWTCSSLSALALRETSVEAARMRELIRTLEIEQPLAMGRFVRSLAGKTNGAIELRAKHLRSKVRVWQLVRVAASESGAA